MSSRNICKNETVYTKKNQTLCEQDDEALIFEPAILCKDANDVMWSGEFISVGWSRVAPNWDGLIVPK